MLYRGADWNSLPLGTAGPITDVIRANSGVCGRVPAIPGLVAAAFHYVFSGSNTSGIPRRVPEGNAVHLVEHLLAPAGSVFGGATTGHSLRKHGEAKKVSLIAQTRNANASLVGCAQVISLLDDNSRSHSDLVANTLGIDGTYPRQAGNHWMS